MNKYFLIILLSSFSNYLLSQITFDSAYYVNNEGIRTECYIKNMGWLYTPSYFNFKLEPEGRIYLATLDDASEFGIYKEVNFVRKTVKIDTSSNILEELSEEFGPQWKMKKVFLEQITDGKVRLFAYSDSRVQRYFYSIGDSGVHQLIYKRYRKSKSLLGTNETFKQQLWSQVNFEKLPMSYFSQISYSRKSLERYFKKQNAFLNPEAEIEISKQSHRWQYHLKPQGGLSLTTISFDNAVSSSNPQSTNAYSAQDVDFESKIQYSFGLELELVLPTHQNKMSLFFSPTYHYYYAQKQLLVQQVKFNYPSVNVPIGIRYYLHHTNGNKSFVNVSYTPSFELNFESTLHFEYLDIEIATGGNLSLGAGTTWGKLHIEVRYSFNRNLLQNYTSWYTNYTRASLILGYQLF